MLSKESLTDKFNSCLETNKEIGFVEKVLHPVIYVKGLPKARVWEVVYLDTGYMGVVMSLNDEYVEILLLSNEPVASGTQVSRSDTLLKVPVGTSLLGHVISPLGDSLNLDMPLHSIKEFGNIDVTPLGIEFRSRIKAPLETGVSIVDFLIPLGKGQRELIIGDRNIGKTTFVLQTMLSQARKGAICIYAGIGKKRHSVKDVEGFLKSHGVMDNCIIVASGASDSLAEIYITPYTAMTIAEYYRDMGKDVLIILDDLTTHAKYYRELSLIMKKFPGRDSYPGDVFYAHSRLLERAGNFKVKDGTASITCLPIAETIGGDISGYIQTNLMSITDGHLFFDQDMYKVGKRPSINYFLSVTRVGRQTQSSVRWGINRELSSFMTLHSKTERFIHFGAELNEGIKSTLKMGENINFFFDQGNDEILDLNVQIIIFSLIWTNVLQNETTGKVKFYMTKCQSLYLNDEVFRKKVTDFIDSCDSFNTLLGRLSKESKSFIEYMEKEEPLK